MSRIIKRPRLSEEIASLDNDIRNEMKCPGCNKGKSDSENESDGEGKTKNGNSKKLMYDTFR